jgi:hypothetical protein
MVAPECKAATEDFDIEDRAVLPHILGTSTELPTLPNVLNVLLEQVVTGGMNE